MAANANKEYGYFPGDSVQVKSGQRSFLSVKAFFVPASAVHPFSRGFVHLCGKLLSRLDHLFHRFHAEHLIRRLDESIVQHVKVGVNKSREHSLAAQINLLCRLGLCGLVIGSQKYYLAVFYAYGFVNAVCIVY